MSRQAAWQLSLGFLAGKPVVVEPSEAELTSDAGLLPVRVFDERIGWTARLAEALLDPRRDPRHTSAEMLRMRLFGVLADYADQNDHDVLRYDPVFKLIAGRTPDEPPLASQPTLSRFENSIDIASLNRLRDAFLDNFIESFDEPPAYLTFDVDPFDDPTHGQQQLTFFHGHYRQYQYQPRVITCAENDLVVMACLLHGTAAAALGVDDDLDCLVNRLRQAWPDVRIHVRADSAFASPFVYEACERLNIDYTLGLKMNPVLKRASEELLEFAAQQHAESGEPQRLFQPLDYQAGSWSESRFAVIKCEAQAEGTNRRAVLTNRPGARVLPGACYDDYADRGESENRNKELKVGLLADRLSDHRFLANLFRLYLHAGAFNLLVRLRNHIAQPPAAGSGDELPAEALGQPQRRRYFNRRRECDPLGGGQPGTWQTRLIKVAAEVVVSTRRVLIKLSPHWPHLNHYRHIGAEVHSIPSTAPG
jgi:hypothetical protein